MPLQATSGAASYDGFGGGVAAVPNYIEECFSTTLYTGNGSTQTITNGIDLSGKGGLVWMKSRSQVAGHMLYDTASNATLRSDSTSANSGYYPTYINPTSSGFFLDASAGGGFNTNAVTYASWTFRKQPKFFDVVTFTASTGTNTNLRVSHNLGSAPGCIIVKSTTNTNSWWVYHKSLGINKFLILNRTDASSSYTPSWGTSDPTSTDFGFNEVLFCAATPETFVAYLYADNAGGFGLTGTDNVISCGSYTGNGSASGPSISLGYEPQWIMIKRTDSTGDWVMFDNMRGLTVGDGDAFLFANTSAAESTGATRVGPSATGFYLKTVAASLNASGGTYIYIAIRRGPMKVPVDANKVFAPVAYTGTGATRTITAGFPVDLAIPKLRNAATNGAEWYTRLIGPNIALLSAYTAGELARPNELTSFASNTGVVLGDSSTSGGTNASGSTYVDWNFGRAPSFFDEVCYTGTGSVLSLTHNLTVAPEFILIKSRSGSSYWILGANFGSSTYALKDDWGYNASNASRAYSSTVGFNAQPTSTTVSLSTNSALNVSASTYVMYMWATCAGVSKVGTYTGTGALQTINCGFTSGARFVLITRIGVVGDVNTYIYDSARGISSGNDPYLLLETTAAEVTGTNYVDTDSTGFKVTAAAPAGLNASGGTYIFLAIA